MQVCHWQLNYIGNTIFIKMSHLYVAMHDAKQTLFYMYIVCVACMSSSSLVGRHRMRWRSYRSKCLQHSLRRRSRAVRIWRHRHDQLLDLSELSRIVVGKVDRHRHFGAFLDSVVHVFAKTCPRLALLHQWHWNIKCTEFAKEEHPSTERCSLTRELCNKIY